MVHGELETGRALVDFEYKFGLDIIVRLGPCHYFASEGAVGSRLKEAVIAEVEVAGALDADEFNLVVGFFRLAFGLQLDAFAYEEPVAVFTVVDGVALVRLHKGDFREGLGHPEGRGRGFIAVYGTGGYGHRATADPGYESGIIDSCDAAVGGLPGDVVVGGVRGLETDGETRRSAYLDDVLLRAEADSGHVDVLGDDVDVARGGNPSATGGNLGVADSDGLHEPTLDTRHIVLRALPGYGLVRRV